MQWSALAAACRFDGVGGFGGASSVDGAEKLTLLVQLFLTQHLLVAMTETSHTRTAFSITNTKFSVTQPVLFYQLFNPVFLLFHSFTQYRTGVSILGRRPSPYRLMA